MHNPLKSLALAATLTITACASVTPLATHPDTEDRTILVVMTNHSEYPTRDDSTGLWLTELTHFTDTVEAAGFRTEFVSPKGGSVPLDERSLSWMYMDDRAETLLKDDGFSQKLNNTRAAAEVNPEDYAAIYFTGGHGVMWDFRGDESLNALTSAIYQQGGVVSAVCHGVAALVDPVDEQGEPLIQGRKITGFSNREEFLSGLKNEVPFFLEDELVKQGADYQKAFIPFRSYAITDGRIVTGQNPSSAHAVAVQVIDALNRKQ